MAALMAFESMAFPSPFAPYVFMLKVAGRWAKEKIDKKKRTVNPAAFFMVLVLMTVSL
jgi:hypothetical protein